MQSVRDFDLSGEQLDDRSLAVKLPLLCPNTATKELTEIVSLLGRNLGTVHHFGGGHLVNASSGLDASQVVTFVSRLFHSASLSPCLISWSLVKSVGACQCQPITCSTLCTVASDPSHISSPFAWQRSSAKVSGLCSSMRLYFLRQWYEAFCEGSTR